ncbi:YciI family protein [Nocardioides sp. LHG3406-4]|uniref:YciI family protein n=1 Tax=Nocardioides sp. LHG3406-4 TaxID=2804575 RepID=UPI003CE7BA16
MTSYVVLLPGDESHWSSATMEERKATYAKHTRFAEMLAARGDKITGGAELTHSSGARVVRRVGDRLEVTEGPYAESVEQLTGFYCVDTDDLDGLLECVGILAGPDGGIEVREAVESSDPEAG